MTLDRSQIASLGGLTSSHRLGPEGRKRRAAKGGAAVLAARGPGYYKLLAFKRWGRLGPEKAERPRVNRALPKGAADDAGIPLP
jgi:hypothetical protein